MSQQLLDPATMAALQQRFAEVPVGGPVVMRPEDFQAIPSSAQLAGMDPAQRMDPAARLQVKEGLPQKPVIGTARTPGDVTPEQREQLASKFSPIVVPSGAGALRALGREQDTRAKDARERALGVGLAKEEASDLKLQSDLQTNAENVAQAQAQLEASLQQQRISKDAMGAARANAEKYRRQVADEMEFAAHANMTRSAYDQAKATLANPNAGPKERMAAERALAKGKEVDAGAWMGEEPWMRVLVGIGMAISAGMEGYAAGLQGRASNANQVLRDAIQRGLDQQKAKFAKHQEAGVAQANYYDELLRKFEGDEIAADNAFKIAANQAAIARGDLAASQRNDREAKVAWAQTRAEIMAETEELMAKGAQRYEDNAYRAKLAAGEAQAAAGRTQAAINARAQGPGGARGKALPAETAVKVGDMKTAHQTADDLLKSFRTMDAENWTGRVGAFIDSMVPLVTTDEKKFDQERRLAAQTIGYILEGGKLMDADYARYLDMLPSATDSEEMAAMKIQNMKRQVAEKARGQVQTLGGSGYNTSGIMLPGEDEHMPAADDIDEGAPVY
jgi:hypothetical protein